MRILHLLFGTAWGGAERMACTIHRLARAHGHASSLEARGLRDVVAGVRRETGLELAADSQRSSLLGFVRAVRALHRGERFDLVHAHLATPGLASAAWASAGGLPLVVTFHLLPRAARWPNDYGLPLSSQSLLRALRRLKRRLAFVAVSSADRDALRARFGGAIELAVNAPPLAPAHAESVAVLPALASPGVRLLSVGRLHEQKGFDRLLRALSTLSELPWHWFIVGEGEQRPLLERLVREYVLAERVTFLGALPAESLFAQADLVVCPSRFEGMPLVPLEALSARVPLVVSPIPAHCELFAQAPESLLPADDAQWSLRLRELLGSQRARSELRSAQATLTATDPRERLWDDYASIYRRVLSA